jgi:hypothetical protein
MNEMLIVIQTWQKSESFWQEVVGEEWQLVAGVCIFPLLLLLRHCRAFLCSLDVEMVRPFVVDIVLRWDCAVSLRAEDICERCPRGTCILVFTRLLLLEESHNIITCSSIEEVQFW